MFKVQLMIEKCENLIIFQLQKKLRSPANEFLLHVVGAIGKFKKSNKKLILKKCTSPVKKFLFHKHRNNRKI